MVPGVSAFADHPLLASPPACNCSGRSEECFYDPELYRRSGHGGHCRHCRDNTAGPRCERCRQNHYRWEPRAACQPCHCHPAGAWGAAGHGEGAGGKGLVGAAQLGDVPVVLVPVVLCRRVWAGSARGWGGTLERLR